ncbi:hypothetical protein DVK02_13605 [Halobellus sp. Atlit-31R]|nr:hypothetical protein DVK02_13605 [Halobellus sp. Atlit-31R]
MPRGMDERFEDPSDGEEAEDSGTREAENRSRDSEPDDRSTRAAPGESPNQQQASPTGHTESAESAAEDTDEEPLNIREDWDSATIYVEPEQSEDIEITFTRLKKRLKREDVVLEKNKHFYRGIFEVAFGEHREETKEKIRDLAKDDIDQ